MQIECPPPRAIWARLLKFCSLADLGLLRSQTLMRIAHLDETMSLSTDSDCAAFLGAILRESRRR